jgi:hypothetical protein
MKLRERPAGLEIRAMVSINAKGTECKSPAPAAD